MVTFKRRGVWGTSSLEWNVGGVVNGKVYIISRVKRGGGVGV